MKKIFFLVLILLNTVFLRIYKIGLVPPLKSQADLDLRYLSSILGILSVFLIYFYVKKIFQENVRMGLLGAWVFSLLPWTIEQNRIISQPTYALFILIIALLISLVNKNKIIKYGVFFVFALILYFVYPQFWLFRHFAHLPGIKDVADNVFILVSPDLLFFKNITFWWGGVRDYGILLLGFLPFLLVGFYRVVVSQKKEILLPFFLLLMISALSLFFPESREYYLTLPFITVFISVGIWNIFRNKYFLSNVLSVFLFLFLIYDFAGFLHFYQIHYPQFIIGNLHNIHVPY
ncbi:MAG: hypothetical protein M1366_04365 [Patescibacteria group bacterium]|nr:hypothetical protein [Patescibacteria group bacterium]